MSPFRNLTDFNLAVAVLSRLPAFLPGRNDRLAHFLNYSLTDKSFTITPCHIAPFEQGVRALDPDLLSVRNPYDTAVKRVNLATLYTIHCSNLIVSNTQ